MEKYEKKLSIVVPVYNVERYLEECVNSIISSTLDSYEIILVDDGSTDNSGKLCDSLKKKYNNIITVIHKKNGGLSSARNEGIKISKGKYLMFVDSDDKILDFDINKFIKNEPDIIQYKMVYFFENDEKYLKLKDIDDKQENDIINVINNQIVNGTLSISACDKIVKKQIIINNNLFFKEGLFSEDINWSLELYLCANTIELFNEDIYIYRQQRNGSITNTTSNKNITSVIYILNRWLEYNYSSEIVKRVYMNYLAYVYCILIAISTKKNTTLEQRNFIKKHKNIISYDDNYKVKYCHKAISILGLNLGSIILKIYLRLKNKGIVKI